MKTREWRWDKIKPSWGPGPWEEEPDKRQWTDPATGLPCLIVRNRLGGLCGYVGVPPSHPWYGRDYSSCTLPVATPRGPREGDQDGLMAKLGPEWRKRQEEQLVCKEDYCAHTPSSIIEVHGGLTFADHCAPITPERWEAFRQQRPAMEAMAAKHPQGDAADDLRDWAGTWDSYEAWAEQQTAMTICHVPEPGEPPLWWFGFDCGHAGDILPGMARFFRAPTGYLQTYKNLTYVTRQCARLAEQLRAAAPQMRAVSFVDETQ